ncbi:hypothetical protein PspLS_03570 [Pyricularia sp. CBS 133598]|nr:hypothetical protein PspLS_03570 [Pyricularia sp. CBS 133598]
MTLNNTTEKGSLAPPKAAVTSETTKILEKVSTDTLSPESIAMGGRGARNGGSSGLSTPTSVTGAPLNPFDTDIEAQAKMHTTDTREQTRHFLGRSSTNLARGESHAAGANDDCQVWPGQAHWKRKHKAAKRKNRNCNCLASLSRRNRMIVKIFIGLFIIATAVGVGFGISKPLGARIWKPNNQ